MRIQLLVVAGCISIASATYGTASPHVGESTMRRTGSCASNAAAADWLLQWVKHTIADTGRYPAMRRSGASLPQRSADSASLVSVDSVCASLGLAFARLAPGRDTLAPPAVYVVFVASTAYVVTDFKPGAVPPVRVSGDTLEFNSGPQWADAVTFSAAYAPIVAWHWAYVSNFP